MPRKHSKRASKDLRRPARADDRADLGYSVKQVQQRKANCAAKERYETEAEARSHAIMHAPGSGQRTRAYLCEVCDGWHLTRG